MMKKCPKCGTVSDNNFCPDCGTNLANAQDVYICPACGAESDSVFCPECGTRIINEITESSSPEAVSAESAVTEDPSATKDPAATDKSAGKSKASTALKAFLGIITTVVLIFAAIILILTYVTGLPEEFSINYDTSVMIDGARTEDIKDSIELTVEFSNGKVEKADPSLWYIKEPEVLTAPETTLTIVYDEFDETEITIDVFEQEEAVS